MPRNRWVIFSKKVYLDYDASQIPPEWLVMFYVSLDVTVGSLYNFFA